MAKVKDAEVSVNKTTIDITVIIDKFNAAKSSETPRMNRLDLAKEINIHPQIFVHWKAGTTPNVVDSIFDTIKFLQDKNLIAEFIEQWQPSTVPTIFDHIIQLMVIGQCNVEDFITRAN